MGKVLTPEFISSDEISTEDGKEVIFVKSTLAKPKSSKLFSKLDDNYCLKNLSKPPGKQSRE